MNVLLYLILIFVSCLGLCVGMVFIQNRYGYDKGKSSNSKARYKSYKKLAIAFFIVVIVVTLIYGFVPYQGETGFGIYVSEHNSSNLLSINNILRVLVIELTIGLLIIVVARYRGRQIKNSPFADSQYLKQFSRKVLRRSYICMSVTLIILLIISIYKD